MSNFRKKPVVIEAAASAPPESLRFGSDSDFVEFFADGDIQWSIYLDYTNDLNSVFEMTRAQMEELRDFLTLALARAAAP